MNLDNNKISWFVTASVVFYLLIEHLMFFLLYKTTSFGKNYIILSSCLVMSYYSLNVVNNGLKVQKKIFSPFILFLTGLVSLFFQYSFIGDYFDSNGSVIYRLFYILFLSFCWLVIGYNFSIQLIKSNAVYKCLLVLFQILFLFLISLNINQGPFVDYLDITNKHNLPTGVYKSHLDITDAYVLVGFICYFSFSSKMRLVSLCVFIVGLFLLGGRAALFLTIVIFMIELVRFLIKNKIYLIIFLLFSFGFLFAIYQYINSIFGNLASLKRFFFSSGVAEDGSALQRVYQFERSLEFLPEQSLFGGYSLNISSGLDFGDYIHNLLSAWQFYGLPFFIFLIVLMFKNINFQFLQEKNAFSFFIYFYSFIMVFLAKYVGFYLFWFSLGLILKANYEVLKSGYRK